MEPKNNDHENTLIFLHGEPGNSTQALHYFIPYNKTYMVPKTTRIILPNASKNGWYETHGDILNLASLGHIQESIYGYVDQNELNHGTNEIIDLVKQELILVGNNAKKIFIGGFG